MPPPVAQPPAARALRSRGGALRVVLYHHIDDGSSPFVDRLGVSTPPEIFEAHLRQLQRDYDVVDLEAVLSGKLPRRPLLITFDDGYRSVAERAAPALRGAGLPAVLFAAPGFIGGRALPLDNLLCYLSHHASAEAIARCLSDGAPACADLRQVIGQVVAGLSATSRAAAADRLGEAFDLDLPALTAAADLYMDDGQLAAMPTYGVEVGNHTSSHVHCRMLDADAAGEELVASKHRLERLTGQPVRAFSYPYGSRADATPLAERTLLESGHEALFLVEARPNPRFHAGPTWHRVSFQDQPASAVRRRLEWLPRLRAAKDRVTGWRHSGQEASR